MPIPIVSNISLESLPSAWENCAEATALVQTLVQCVDLNQGGSSREKLKGMKLFAISEYRRIFEEDKLEEDFGGPVTSVNDVDLINRRASFHFLNGNWKKCDDFLRKAVELEKDKVNTHLNQILFNWQSAQFSDE